MIFKNHVNCGHCHKYLGFRLGSEPMGSIYCSACEDFVTHKEEIREESSRQYRALANRS